MSVFRFGEFAFHCGSRLLFHNGVERHLSPKAHQLLRALLMARPRALSREELYDELWPSTFVAETNLASVVNEVRRALGDDPRAPQYIRTVHGFGYAFCGEVTTAASTRGTVAMLVRDGRQCPLVSGENAVGREVDNQIFLNDLTVSRHHAVVLVVDGTISVRDLGSKNGTFVDGIRIGQTPAALHDGAQVEFGGVTMKVGWRNLSSTQSLQLDMPGIKRAVAQRLAEA